VNLSAVNPQTTTVPDRMVGESEEAKPGAVERNGQETVSDCT
jgi:hypothetical protein